MASAAENSAPPAAPTSVDEDLTEIQETLSETACLDNFAQWVKAKDIDNPSDLKRLKQIVEELRDVMAGRHLLVVDKHVDDADSSLAKAINKVTHTVFYDSKTETKSDLIGKIRARHLTNGKPYESVGFASHAGKAWQMASDLVIPTEGVSTDTVVAQADPVITALISCVGKGGRVDILGCSLLAYLPDLVNRLETIYGINFAASDDRTGNITAGGDWILESDDLDIAPVYFDVEKVKGYSGTMLWWLVGQATKQAAKLAAKQAAKLLATKVVKKLFTKALKNKIKQIVKKRFGKKLSKKFFTNLQKKLQKLLQKKLRKEFEKMTEEEKEEGTDEVVTDAASDYLQEPHNQARLERAADRAANDKLDEIFAFGWDDLIPGWSEAKMIAQIYEATNSSAVTDAVDAAVEREVDKILSEWPKHKIEKKLEIVLDRS